MESTIGYHDNSLPGTLGQQEGGGLVQRMCWILMKEGVSQDPETCAGEKKERQKEREGGRGKGREGREGVRGEGEAKQQVTSAIPNLVSTLCECIN